MMVSKMVAMMMMTTIWSTYWFQSKMVVMIMTTIWSTYWFQPYFKNGGDDDDDDYMKYILISIIKNGSDDDDDDYMKYILISIIVQKWWWWWWWWLHEVHITFNDKIKNRDGFDDDDDDDDYGDDDVDNNDDKMIMTRRSNDGDNENKKIMVFVARLNQFVFCRFASWFEILWPDLLVLCSKMDFPRKLGTVLCLMIIIMSEIAMFDSITTTCLLSRKNLAMCSSFSATTVS